MTPFNFLLELEFLKHQQILQILGHCLVLFLFNVNMPSCPSPWRRVCAVCAWGGGGGGGYSTNIWVWQYPQFYCHAWDKQQNPHCLVLKPFIVWQNYCRRANLCYSHWFTFENLEYNQISSSKSNQSYTVCNTLFITEDRPAQNLIPCLGQIFTQ